MSDISRFLIVMAISAILTLVLVLVYRLVQKRREKRLDQISLAGLANDIKNAKEQRDKFLATFEQPDYTDLLQRTDAFLRQVNPNDQILDRLRTARNHLIVSQKEMSPLLEDYKNTPVPDPTKEPYKLTFAYNTLQGVLRRMNDRADDLRAELSRAEQTVNDLTVRLHELQRDCDNGLDVPPAAEQDPEIQSILHRIGLLLPEAFCALEARLYGHLGNKVKELELALDELTLKLELIADIRPKDASVLHDQLYELRERRDAAQEAYRKLAHSPQTGFLAGISGFGSMADILHTHATYLRLQHERLSNVRGGESANAIAQARYVEACRPFVELARLLYSFIIIQQIEADRLQILMLRLQDMINRHGERVRATEHGVAEFELTFALVRDASCHDDEPASRWSAAIQEQTVIIERLLAETPVFQTSRLQDEWRAAITAHVQSLENLRQKVTDSFDSRATTEGEDQHYPLFSMSPANGATLARLQWLVFMIKHQMQPAIDAARRYNTLLGTPVAIRTTENSASAWSLCLALEALPEQQAANW